MRNGTRLGLTCGRCGQPRELIRHVCVVRSGRAALRRATPKLTLDFGKCETCNRPVGNPFTHVCAPRSDFKRRRRAAAKREKDQARARASRKANKHEYQNCKDDDCKRSACLAYKTGWREGYQIGFVARAGRGRPRVGPTRMGGAGTSDDLTAGHQTQVWLATHHDVTPRTGGFWYQQVQAPHPASQDEDFQAHLIEVLESHTGISLD